MKELNREHIDAVIDFLSRCNYFNLIGLKVTEVGHGYSKVELDFGEKHLNPFGGVHGGVYATLIDCAAFWASYADLDDGAGLISLDLKVDYLAAVKEGKVIVEGKLIKSGRTICLSEARVTDEKGKLLAHGSSKQLVTQGLQSIRESAAARGVLLPPKFLA
jgi:uncharacterized protein (TIGR00369 family)